MFACCRTAAVLEHLKFSQLLAIYSLAFFFVFYDMCLGHRVRGGCFIAGFQGELLVQ